MDDLSLEELQAALVSVQEKKATTRLSERNIVELVTKLQELGLLPADLLHSIQGREYITPDQLRQEVKHAVAHAGGRLALADLPAQLGVDLVHCERQAQNLVQDSAGSVQLIQGDLMTSRYFDGIAAEISDLLQDSGVVEVGDMARRFKLGSELMQGTISSRLGSSIQGRLESGILYTALYIAKIKSQLRGALRAATRPVHLSAVSKSLDLISTGSSGKMVQSIADELVAEGAISGTIKASTFVPAIFAAAQQQAVQDFYSQNHFIELQLLARLGVADPRAFMSGAHPDSLALESAFVSPQLLTQLAAAMEEATLGGHWADALANLPPAISQSDASSLLKKTCASTAQGKVLAGTCLISNQLLDSLRERVRGLAREAADAAIQSRRASAKAASTSVSSAQSAGMQSSGKKLAADVAADSDEDNWDTGKGGSKRKKGARKRPAGKSKGNQSQATQNGKPQQGSTQGDEHADRLSAKSLTAQLEEWLPDAVGAGEDCSFTESLAAELTPVALAEYQEAQAAIFLAGAEARRKKRDGIGRSVEQASQQFQMFACGVDFLQSSETASIAVQRHLLRTHGQKIADLLLLYLEVDVREDDRFTEEGKDWQLPLTPAERSQILSKLSNDSAAPVTAADKALGGASIPDAWETLQEAARAAGLQLRKLDKKVEKSLLQEHKAALRERLKEEDTPAEALSLAVPLLVGQAAGKAISIPGKALAGVIDQLKGALPSEQFSQLAEMHKLVVNDLRSQDNEQNPRLLVLMPSLKAMTGVQQANFTQATVSADS